VLERAWRNGARFDGWAEHFDRAAWDRAFRDEGVDPEHFAHTDYSPKGRLPWHVVHSRVNRKWLELELKRALTEGTLSVCGPKDCHGCAPFARECVRGVVAETTGRSLDSDLPLLATAAAPGPGLPVAVGDAPALRPAATATMPPDPPVERPRFRYRTRFGKTGRMRFLGHLDLTRLLLRALRRAGIALVYSQGFSPKPRVMFSPALSVGVASVGEYLDFDTYERLDPEQARTRINAALPDGVRFEALREIPRGLPALGEAIRAARYRVHTGNGFDLTAELESLHSRGPLSVERERKGKLQTFRLDREMIDCTPLDGDALRLTLALHGGEASVRPEEVLRAIFGERAHGMRLVREELLVDWNGRLINPMLAASASRPRRSPAGYG